MALSSWVLALRVKTLPAAVVPVWVGTVLAWRLTAKIEVGLALCALGGALCLQIATNLFNDLIDYRKGADTDRRTGPVRVTASGLMTPAQVTALAVAMLVGACAFSAPLIAARGWPILAIGVPSLFLSFGYTGGPWPLAYRGLGEAFVILFFGFVAVGGTVFVNTGSWLAGPSLLLGAQVGLLSAVMIAINNLRDIDDDARVGKRTLAVRGGIQWARAEIAVLTLLPYGLGVFWWPILRPLTMVPLAGLVFGVFIVRKISTIPPGPAYNNYLALSGAQLIAFAILFTVAASSC